MFRSKTAAGLTVGLIFFTSVGVVSASGQETSPSVLKSEQLTNRQFHELPDRQAVLHRGERTTLGELRAQWRAQRERMNAKVNAGEARARGELARIANEAQQDQRRKQAAAGEKAKAELARLRGQEPAAATSRDGDPAFARIRKEAAALYDRARKTRSADEKARIEQRARELLDQLRKMGRT
jgi:hypothetical protein